MKTILMPTDGSEPAVKALDVALDLACQHEANVRLMHVLLRDKEAESSRTNWPSPSVLPGPGARAGR